MARKQKTKTEQKQYLALKNASGTVTLFKGQTYHLPDDIAERFLSLGIIKEV